MESLVICECLAPLFKPRSQLLGRGKAGRSVVGNGAAVRGRHLGEGKGGDEEQGKARFKGGWLCSCLVIVHRRLVGSLRYYLLSTCAPFFILNLKGMKTSAETYVIISSFPHFFVPSRRFGWKTLLGRAVLASPHVHQTGEARADFAVRRVQGERERECSTASPAPLFPTPSLARPPSRMLSFTHPIPSPFSLNLTNTPSLLNTLASALRYTLSCSPFLSLNALFSTPSPARPLSRTLSFPRPLAHSPHRVAHFIGTVRPCSIISRTFFLLLPRRAAP